MTFLSKIIDTSPEPIIKEAQEEKDTFHVTNGKENTMWSKSIPGVNYFFLVVSSILVFGVDLYILSSSPELFPFYIEMAVVFIIFSAFLYYENKTLKSKFLYSQGLTLDKWICALIILRNLIFVLNFIPFIQIAGAIALVFGGIPLLAIYAYLVSKRSSSVHTS